MTDHGELEQLKELVRKASPVTVDEVRKVVEKHFTEDVTWSILKDEWQNHMTDRQREGLYTKLLLDAVNSTTSRLKALNLDDIENKR